MDTRQCFTAILILFLPSMNVFAQCTEAKDSEMAKYMTLTKTQDAQGCSPCGMLALYFCSAKYTVEIEDKRKVSAMISNSKKIIRQMGEPYCCPDYLTKEPEWGVMAGASNIKQTSNSSVTSINDKGINNNSKTNSFNNKEIESTINGLVRQLEADPHNPLKIDKIFLSTFSQSLPDGALKSALQSYSVNLGTDPDLSYRQIYWDISNAFNQNLNTKDAKNFNMIKAGIDLLLNNPEKLTEFSKGDNQLNTNIFLNSPSLYSNQPLNSDAYQKIYAISAGLNAVAEIMKGIREDKEYKSDYLKLAKVSTEMSFQEIDKNLARGLIDAFVGVMGRRMLTSIYRYDFENGASLRVENGILKFINLKKNISKDLTSVERRHDGKWNPGDGWQTSGAEIVISADESVFYVSAASALEKKDKCNTCLEAGRGFLINTETGDIIDNESTPSYPLAHNSYFNSLSQMIYPYLGSGGRFCKLNYFDNKKWRPFELNKKIDEEKMFLFDKTPIAYKSFMKVVFPVDQKSHYSFEKDNSIINLIWAYRETEDLTDSREIFGSSMIQVANEDAKFHSDGLVNELTGLTMKKDKTLFFTDKNGGIGKLIGSNYNINDPNFPIQLRSSLNKGNLPKYNFIVNRKYTADHGRRNTFRYNIFPSLTLTPDEKWLIYVINDDLYLINPENFDDTKNFKATFQPNNLFFTKENGDWVLNLQGLNDFKFPITKKYSISKLAAINTRKVGSENTTPSTKSKNSEKSTRISVADEIEKLKKLLDSGTITKDEFEAAKKQLLNK